MKNIWLIAAISMVLGITSCSKDDDKEITVYTVTFDTDGGSPVPAAQRIESGSIVSAPATNPTKTGYTFIYWYLNDINTAYNFQAPVNNNITLFAKWQEEKTVEYWQVTWELNGGQWPSTDNHATQVAKGGTLAEPNAPSKSGNTFEGWYKETALTNKVSFPYNVNNETANITMYAKWTSSEEPGDEDDKYKMFTSIDALKSWLVTQSGNTVYKVGLQGVNLDNGNNWGDLGIYINEARKKVDLDLSKCTSTAIPDGYRERIPRPDQVIAYKTYGVFVDCDYLITIKLPEGLKTIGDYAFYESDRLTSVALPEGLTAIKTRAFDSCSQLSTITLPAGLKEIKYGAFSANKFTSIDIPRSVSDLGAYAFDFCNALTSVTLNEGLKIIGTGTFEHCESLESIRIPASVTSIEGSAFQNCKSLTEIIMLSATPPSMGDHVFGYSVANYTIKVPAASLDAYKKANGWKDYADKIVANNN